MTQQTYASLFTQVFISAPGAVNLTGTLTEMSQYTKLAEATTDFLDADVSTFAAGGLWVTETHVHGALTAQFKWDMLYDPVAYMILSQYMANFNGFVVLAKKGSYGPPTYGDEFFAMQTQLQKLPITYKGGATADMTPTLMPIDGATLFPVFGTL